MSTAHTPGPWYAVGYWVEHEDDSVADICTCDPAAIGQEHLGRTDEEIAANARLIASAPDLLNMLEEALEAIEYFDEHEGASDLLDAARAAIAKATGEQQ